MNAHAGIRQRSSPRRGATPMQLALRAPGVATALADRGACACGGGCPRCSAARSGLRLQRKSTIGAPDDAYEREADAVAEQILRRPETGFPPARAGATTPRRREAAGDGSTRTPSAGAAFTAPGQPLDADSRAYFEPRFGRALGEVRLHTDAAARRSADTIDARAFTVGTHIVFGDRYVPASAASRSLLAHELVHVIQQGGGQRGDSATGAVAIAAIAPTAQAALVQRACRSPAQCATASTGDAAGFGADVEAQEEALALASGGTVPAAGGPASCLLPRHGQRATHFEALATGAGLGASFAPNTDGYFINACLAADDGALNTTCGNFRGGAPAGTQASHTCVQVHAADEDLAQRLQAQPRPLGDADLRRFLWIVSTVTHESQHNIFDANPAAIVPAAADCNVNSPVPSGGTVEERLSEISAETAEFHVYFRNAQLSPSASARNALASEEHDIASRGGENILGNIRSLQCACNCDTVDRFVEQVFAQASTSWTADEQLEFKRGMTDFIPGFWPRSLQARRPPRPAASGGI
jgi:hypothetical protein